MARILVTSIHCYADVPNGNARIACDLAHGFARAGHQVWYLCETPSGSMPEMEADGAVTVLRYRMDRAGAGARFRLRQRRIAEMLNRFLPRPPDIIHGHAPLQYLAVRKVYGRQGRWCYTVHSPVVEEMRIVWGRRDWLSRCKAWVGLPWLQRMEYGLLQWSDAIISLSEYTRSLLANRHGRRLAGRIKCIPGWTDTQVFRPLAESVPEARARLKWPADCPVFFALRRLEQRTGVDALLQACYLVRKAGYKFHTVIAGAGSQEAALRDLCRRLDLDRTVSFMGRIAQKVLPLAYGACDASVIPTAQLECFGIIALEALACGRPALVTPVGALPEIMRQFELEWISKNNTPEGIADLLCRYLGGALPAYDREHIQSKLAYFSLDRALRDYSSCLGLEAEKDSPTCA